MADALAYFREQLLTWGRAHRRAFPWRDTDDPYRILIAELMLRRTQALQVTPVYEAFLRRFPTISALATAPEADVAAALYPLGLAWRVANFTGLARKLSAEHSSTIPRDRDQLLALPGVGDYVASAVRCLAFSEPDPLIDTNTVRVAGRYLGFLTHAESRRNPAVRAAVASLFDPDHPRDSALALLDFAHFICRARRPRCADCPVASHCLWHISTLQRDEEQ